MVFRTLDIGSDKVLPYMKRADEPNPALGWRAIRVGLDRPGIMRMQVQALIRGAKGRPLTVMFPFVAEAAEFEAARALVLERDRPRAAPRPHRARELRIGAMLETPSLAYAPDRFFQLADFVSIGGNDLKQFFFAADRENELVRRRYDMLSVSFLDLPRADRRPLRRARHAALLLRRGRRPPGRGAGAGRRRLPQPVDAPRLDRPGQGAPAPGRPRRARAVIDAARVAGARSARPGLEAWMQKAGFHP